MSVVMLLCLYVDSRPCISLLFFFFNDTATPEIYTLSLHDALPISAQTRDGGGRGLLGDPDLLRLPADLRAHGRRDRKSTRLNSSHTVISYAVFCLKKKKKLLLSWATSAARSSIQGRAPAVRWASVA